MNTDLDLSEHRYQGILARLSNASVKKHFDAYADVAWDDPAHAIDETDPRFIRDENDPLGATDWYRALPEPTRARVGLALLAAQMKMGIQFENILSRGLLQFAEALPNGSPEYRYAYHEVIEEGQHSLMFQEFVNRSGFDATGIQGWRGVVSRTVPRLGRAFPELFFIHVLAGEEPIDHVQRRELRRGAGLHPLVRRIMQIHVTEEARHVRFAHEYLERNVPRLSRARLFELRVVAPFVIAETTALMLRPPSSLFSKLGVPRSVVKEAYDSPAQRRLTLEGVAPIRTLCKNLGILTPGTAPLWRALGISETSRPARALHSGGPRLLEK